MKPANRNLNAIVDHGLFLRKYKGGEIADEILTLSGFKTQDKEIVPECVVDWVTVQDCSNTGHLDQTIECNCTTFTGWAKSTAKVLGFSESSSSESEHTDMETNSRKHTISAEVGAKAAYDKYAELSGKVGYKFEKAWEKQSKSLLRNSKRREEFSQMTINFQQSELKIMSRTLRTPAGYVNRHVRARMLCGDIQFLSALEDIFSYPQRNNVTAEMPL
ncbi:hypothetical protein AAVH_34347 [Aphelenchoides avenae]|nr:hypothetical protein AAVH_34347 [Aphelenchus avenae]